MGKTGGIGRGKDIDVRLRRRQTLHGETRASDRCIRSKKRVHRGCELISLDDTAEQKAREGVDNGKCWDNNTLHLLMIVHHVVAQLTNSDWHVPTGW